MTMLLLEARFFWFFLFFFWLPHQSWSHIVIKCQTIMLPIPRMAMQNQHVEKARAFLTMNWPRSFLVDLVLANHPICDYFFPRLLRAKAPFRLLEALGCVENGWLGYLLGRWHLNHPEMFWTNHHTISGRVQSEDLLLVCSCRNVQICCISKNNIKS